MEKEFSLLAVFIHCRASKRTVDIGFITVRFMRGKAHSKVVPAPGLEGVAGPLVQIALHHDPISCVTIKVHNGVIIRHVLEIFKKLKSHCVICFKAFFFSPHSFNCVYKK